MGSRTNARETAAQGASTVAAAQLAARRLRRGRARRSRREAAPAPLPALPAVPPTPAADPVRIAVLAMENLGRASLRASVSGTEVRVAAPDAATAAIFRAALAQTAQTRVTDRLIRVVIG